MHILVVRISGICAMHFSVGVIKSTFITQYVRNDPVLWRCNTPFTIFENNKKPLTWQMNVVPKFDIGDNHIIVQQNHNALLAVISTNAIVQISVSKRIWNNYISMHLMKHQSQKYINSLSPSNAYMRCKQTIICSDNGLSPGRCQVLMCTNAGISLTGPFRTNFSGISIEINTFLFQKMHLKVHLENSSQLDSAPIC